MSERLPSCSHELISAQQGREVQHSQTVNPRNSEEMVQALSPVSTTEEAGLQVHPLLENPHGSSAGDTAHGKQGLVDFAVACVTICYQRNKMQLAVCK